MVQLHITNKFNFANLSTAVFCKAYPRLQSTTVSCDIKLTPSTKNEHCNLYLAAVTLTLLQTICNMARKNFSLQDRLCKITLKIVKLYELFLWLIQKKLRKKLSKKKIYVCATSTMLLAKFQACFLQQWKVWKSFRGMPSDSQYSNIWELIWRSECLLCNFRDSFECFHREWSDR